MELTAPLIHQLKGVLETQGPRWNHSPTVPLIITWGLIPGLGQISLRGRRGNGTNFSTTLHLKQMKLRACICVALGSFGLFLALNTAHGFRDFILWFHRISFLPCRISGSVHSRRAHTLNHISTSCHYKVFRFTPNTSDYCTCRNKSLSWKDPRDTEEISPAIKNWILNV